ncbi:DUF3343 domain-containing protein [Caldanaerobacter subterraneus]|uniref:DUF3343 domain-containing protein n=1 Tax=Caldanaerobacter subterraneus TaxID=911092 RepID=A0A7Y2L8Z0_9THEO|nr:DUF3343 domain-containing protein [Caldanaerobacter subterraneus]NNG66601.1 DUF3343 domain-containing protein [Caldanaerobacter subterraneus]
MKGNYIAFPSVNYVIKAEGILKRENLWYKVVPTPRSIDLSCGISIMYDKKDEEVIRKLLEENGVLLKGFYSID